MLDNLRDLTPPTWVIVVLTLITIALVFNDAVLGRREYQRFAEAVRAARADDAARIRARFLLQWAWQPWVLTIITLVFVALAPDVRLRWLGFAWPDFSPLSSIAAGRGAAGGAVLGVVIGAGAALIGGFIGAMIAARRRAQEQSDPGKAPSDAHTPQRASLAANRRVELMLPTSRRDRRAWLLLSLTAGITEEIMYRGLFLLTVALLFPAAPAFLLYAIVVLGFAAAHTYQGWVGVAATGFMGAVLLLVYVATGSILLGIILHFLADARAALR